MTDNKKYITFGEERTAMDFKNELRDMEFTESIENKEEFWKKAAGNVEWSKFPTKILDESDQFMKKWFVDGEMNMCHNAIDRHINNGLGDTIAFAYDSVYTGEKVKYTYNQLQQHVGKLASVMQTKFGVQTGDRVLIYMPMIAQAGFAMLACARIGAVHSVVFGGFAAKELANRLDDSLPKLIITCSAGIEPNKIIKYAPIVDASLALCQRYPDAANAKRLVVNRPAPHNDASLLDRPEYFDYDAVMSEQDWPIAPCVMVPSNHPLYILYTSGTTGQPKGVVRDHGGSATGISYANENVFDFGPGKTFFAMSDIGWVVGHSFIIYGPLLAGGCAIFFEGKPIIPNVGVAWRVIEEYKVTHLYWAPTAVRVVKKEDYEGVYVKQYDISSLESVSVVGERCDPDTVQWMHRHMPNAIINDTWWQTETGWPICANLMNTNKYKKVYPNKPGSVYLPVPGYDVKVFDESNNQVAPGALGKVVIKLPMPPSFMNTLWGNDEAFIAKYLTDTPGYYTTGDAGMFDEHGYFHIMTRLDDVINTAGHRISTGRLEEVINDHVLVAESAVLGFNHPLRGETPLAFVILNGAQGFEALPIERRQELIKEINGKVRSDVGAFAKLEGVLFLNRLPKTRSGKILRGTMRKIANKEEYSAPATIDDMSTLDTIKDLCKQHRIATGLDAPEAPKSQSPVKTQVQAESNSHTPVRAEATNALPSGSQPSNQQPEKPQLTPEELKQLKKEQAEKRKQAAAARFEPRVLRPRASRDSSNKPAKKVGEKRQASEALEQSASKIQRTTD